MSLRWLGVAEVVRSVGVTRRSATRILCRQHFAGHPLEVRLVHGRGGRSGVSYQVSLASLEAALEGRSNAPQTIHEPADLEPRRNASNQDARIIERLNLVLPVLEHPERSAERKAAVEAASKRAGVSARTVERWTTGYERSGVAGLGRRKPSNAGKRRVHVSLTFDRAFRAAGYPEPDLSRIGAEIEKALKGLWASRSEIAGWAEVRRLAEFLLLEACEAGGFELAPSALRLSRRHVERFAEPFNPCWRHNARHEQLSVRRRNAADG